VNAERHLRRHSGGRRGAALLPSLQLRACSLFMHLPASAAREQAKTAVGGRGGCAHGVRAV